VYLPPKAQVYGHDGHLGHALKLIIDPVRKRVTHLVVKGAGLGGQERLVPTEDVVATQSNRITLNCDKEGFKRYDPFMETRFIELDMPSYLEYEGWSPVGWPYVSPVSHDYFMEVELIPEGELTVQRGMRVDASDGQVGRVDEFVVEPSSGRIGHLVMRQGHVFGQKDVFIPVNAIKKTEDERVVLNLNKHEVDLLRHIPVRRLWKVEQL
jgi:sporulation protein YlmC with PRC-barrel domain